MRTRLVFLLICSLSRIVLAEKPPKEKRVAGEVVALSRSTIMPNWGPTARAAAQNIADKCYPIAGEAVLQLMQFYEILEIARTRVPKDDPIAAGQAARKAEVDKLKKAVEEMPKVNTGCPDVPVPEKRERERERSNTRRESVRTAKE